MLNHFNAAVKYWFVSSYSVIRIVTVLQVFTDVSRLKVLFSSETDHLAF